MVSTGCSRAGGEWCGGDTPSASEVSGSPLGPFRDVSPGLTGAPSRIARAGAVARQRGTDDVGGNDRSESRTTARSARRLELGSVVGGSRLLSGARESCLCFERPLRCAPSKHAHASVVRPSARSFGIGLAEKGRDEDTRCARGWSSCRLRRRSGWWCVRPQSSSGQAAAPDPDESDSTRQLDVLDLIQDPRASLLGGIDVASREPMELLGDDRAEELPTARSARRLELGSVVRGSRLLFGRTGFWSVLRTSFAVCALEARLRVGRPGPPPGR